MKTCCIIVVSKLIRVVLQMCLQTIWSVPSSDGQMVIWNQYVNVTDHNIHNYVQASTWVIVNTVITLYVAGLRYLTVAMNHIPEQLNEYLLKTTKTGLKQNQF